MSRRPFGCLAAVAALNSRLKRGGAGQRLEHRRPAHRVVAGAGDVADAELVGLIFLLAAETQRSELRVDLRALGDFFAECAADHRAKNRAEYAEYRIALR